MRYVQRRRNRRRALLDFFSPLRPSQYNAPDYVFLIAALLLLFFGLLFLSSATSILSFEFSKHSTSYFFLKQQITHGVLPGLILFVVLMHIPHSAYVKIRPFLLVATYGLLLAVFIPGIGVVYNNVRGWVSFAGINFQPAEIAKLTFILWLAVWLAGRQDRIKQFRVTTLPFAIHISLISALLMLQPDLGTTVLFVAVSFLLFFIANANMIHIGLLSVSGVLAMLTLIVSAPYRLQRLITFWNPTLDIKGAGYQIHQALIAIGSGSWFGVGIGQSRQKFLYLPEVASDSIFAVIGEEAGLIFSAFILILFVILFIRGFSLAKRSADTTSGLIITGITLMITVQACINVASIIGLIPLTGLPLPFISLGGTNLSVLLAALGIITSASRRNSHG